MAFCLVKNLATEFKKKLKSGEINPEKISQMTSQERREYFSGFLDEENAREVNALFESKLLLKNQQKGIINWAKQVVGMKPEIKKDILTRVGKMTEILSPQEENAFLEDLASKKLGIDVTENEASKLVELSQNIDEKQKLMNEGGDRMEYGRAKVEFMNYVSDLKDTNKLTFKESVKEAVKSPAKALVDIGGLSKSIKAALDNSAILRQGFRTAFTNPEIWAKNSASSFLNIAKSIGGKNIMNEVMADIFSRPNYDLYTKGKLAIGNIEEAYPSSFPEKIPGLGRLFKASQDTYESFLYKMRADIFDKYIEIAQKTGVDITDKKQLESIGTVINSLTGRGKLGGFERAADTLNNLFFSPRFLKSHIDFLTSHAFDNTTMFAKKLAALNLLKVISGMAALFTIFRFLDKDSLELDPRSSDFGNVKYGDTRFNISGGMNTLAVLAARLATQSTKSTTTKEITELNTDKFGSKTGMDVFYNFMENKLSPAASVIKDLIKGQTSDFKKPTVLGEAKNLLVPLPITNTQELLDNPNSAPVLLGMLADFIGIGTNTYSSSAKELKDKLKGKLNTTINKEDLKAKLKSKLKK